MKRRILYVSGTRADFGLLEKTLQAISSDPSLELGVCVTGMHLDAYYGGTVKEIEDSGLSVVARVPLDLGKGDRKSTRLNSSHSDRSRMPSSA